MQLDGAANDALQSCYYGVAIVRRFKFSAATLARHLVAPSGEAKQTVVWDSATRGLGAYRGKTSGGSFFVHFRVGSLQRKTTIGRVNELAVADAQARAVEIMLAASQGRDLVRERAVAEQPHITLAEAYAEYATALLRKGASPKTCALNEHNWRKMLSPHAARELHSITRREVRAWHEEWGRYGPTGANHGARLLRTIYNYAAKRLADDLPANPSVAVEFYPERGMRRSVAWEALPSWWAKVISLSNPVRRSYWKLLLFSGLRMTDAATIRAEDVSDMLLHRPSPKGGRSRAYDLPITRQLRAILDEAQIAACQFQPNSPWLFPAASACGHVLNMRERTAFPGIWPHDLRRTYATACVEAGVDPYTIKLLLNHAMDKGDVTSRYVRLSAQHVQDVTQRVADFIEARIAGVS